VGGGTGGTGGLDHVQSRHVEGHLLVGLVPDDEPVLVYYRRDGRRRPSSAPSCPALGELVDEPASEIAHRADPVWGRPAGLAYSGCVR